MEVRLHSVCGIDQWYAHAYTTHHGQCRERSTIARQTSKWIACSWLLWSWRHEWCSINWCRLEVVEYEGCVWHPFTTRESTDIRVSRGGDQLPSYKMFAPGKWRTNIHTRAWTKWLLFRSRHFQIHCQHLPWCISIDRLNTPKRQPVTVMVYCTGRK